MPRISDTTLTEERPLAKHPLPPEGRTACFHCGESCPDDTFTDGEKVFCCNGCRVVHEVLTENGLGHFYDLNPSPGIRVRGELQRDRWGFLDNPALQAQLLDFTDGRTSKITLHLPAIHCIACVWLLENLFQLHPGVGPSQVNFPKREVALSFAPDRIKLSELVALLSSIGYEPALNLAQTEKRTPDATPRRLWLQVGIAGFAFGNTMLFSVTSYLGLDAAAEPGLVRFFGWLSILLAIPVLGFSAADYWRSAWLGLRQRTLTIDLPIAAGLAALFVQSVVEIASGQGEGYLDSLTGLIFFLLIGKVFQQKTYAQLSFDRDYKSFFPLSVQRWAGPGVETVPIALLRVGDRLRLRHGEIIPADACLVAGHGVIDYSFVTGESAPAEKKTGDYLYAGGRQMGGAIEVETLKPVSHSYLTSLWSHEAFAKSRKDTLNNLTNRFSRWFTAVVIVIAVGAAVYWAGTDPGRAVKAFTSVLIVACPCALALAAPFALGTAQRLLARGQVFLRNQEVIETLAHVTSVVFDKTGTLTAPGGGSVAFQGAPLSPEETAGLAALTGQSTHPYSTRIQSSLGRIALGCRVESFTETTGSGIEGWVEVTGPTSGEPSQNRCPADESAAGTAGSKARMEIQLGSAAWLAARGVAVPETAPSGGAGVHLAIDHRYRGGFQLSNALRTQTDALLTQMAAEYELALLSGDTDKERDLFQALLGNSAPMRFDQSPLDKLGYIRSRQQAGQRVMMVGDGLNDAGALRQSDTGVAVVERIGAFSPASDVILEARRLPRLPAILRFAKSTVLVVYASFAISSLYNALGIAIAALGWLSPVICAILMPLSSVSVVAFACLATDWVGRRAGLSRKNWLGGEGDA